MPVTETSTAPAADALDTPADSGDGPDLGLQWLAPAHRAAPAEALHRIRQICELNPELFGALMTVLCTHQGLRHELLAAALKNFRRDLDAYSAEDVVGLLRACWNGGWQGFDAVLRTRRNRDGRVTGGLSWVKTDD